MKNVYGSLFFNYLDRWVGREATSFELIENGNFSEAMNTRILVVLILHHRASAYCGCIYESRALLRMLIWSLCVGHGCRCMVQLIEGSLIIYSITRTKIT